MSNYKELTLTRIIDAPIEMVFDAWVNESELAKWWGPSGFTNAVCSLDARPGGAIHIDMAGPNGTVYPMGGTVHEINAPTRFVFTSTSFEDDEGNAQLENLNTLTLEEHGNQTKLTLHIAVMKAVSNTIEAFKTNEGIDNMEQGWSESLERLTNLVTNQSIII